VSGGGGGGERERQELIELAQLYGVQPGYFDVRGNHVMAGNESLLAAVEALAGPLDGMESVAEMLAARRDELAGRLIEPVLVAWEGCRCGCRRAPAVRWSVTSISRAASAAPGRATWRACRRRRRRCGGWRCPSRCRSAITGWKCGRRGGRRWRG
jgi:hypothetical protein